MNRKGFSSSVLLTTVLLIGALVVGCGSGPVESFGVEVYARAAPSGELFESAGSLQLKEIPDLDPELEGLLLPGEEGFSSSEYELVYPEEGEAAGAWGSRSLHIVYTSEQPLVLELLSGDNKKKEELTPQHRRLPATAGQEVRIVLPLGGEPLRFLQFHSEGAGDPSFNLRSLALQKENPPEAAVFYLPIPGAHEGAGSRFQQYGYTLEYSYHREMIPAARIASIPAKVAGSGTAVGAGGVPCPQFPRTMSRSSPPTKPSFDGSP